MHTVERHAWKYPKALAKEKRSVGTQSVKATYDAWSETYDQSVSQMAEVEEIVVKSLLRSLSFTDVLDAATGTGRYACYLAEKGKRVTAVDFSRKMLAEARRKAKERGLSVDFRCEDISDLSFADSSYDLVVCALALAHVDDLEKPIKEFVRVLRSGGHLIITDLHPQMQASLGPCYKADIAGKERFFPNYHMSVEKYTDTLKAVGANVVAAIDIPKLRQGVEPGGLLVWAEKPN
jgi:ubiquinone/menaquinone biosynthesis C-methylase UbiE